MIGQIQWIQFIELQNILIPFFIVGLMIAVIQIKKQTKIKLIMFILIITAIFSYINTPLKDIRYLFTLLIPTFYFSYIGIDYIIKKIKHGKKLEVTAVIIFIINLILILSITNIIANQFNIIDKKEVYNDITKSINELNITNCSIMSNGWVPLNYLDIKSKSFPRQERLNEKIEEGEIILILKNIHEPEYFKNEELIRALPIIKETKDYIIISKENCKQIQEGDTTYLNQLKENVKKIKNKEINTDPCIILFHSSHFMEKTCNFINLKGFKLEDNRIYKYEQKTIS
jgi:hypothetical protein